MSDEVKLLPCDVEQAAIYAWEAAPSRMAGCFRLWNEVPEKEKDEWRAIARAANTRPTTVVTDEVVEPSGLPDMVERVARAMAQASGRDPDGITAPTRGQLGSRKLWELYVPQAQAALEASHHAELVEALEQIKKYTSDTLAKGRASAALDLIGGAQ